MTKLQGKARQRRRAQMSRQGRSRKGQVRDSHGGTARTGVQERHLHCDGCDAHGPEIIGSGHGSSFWLCDACQDDPLYAPDDSDALADVCGAVRDALHALSTLSIQMAHAQQELLLRDWLHAEMEDAWQTMALAQRDAYVTLLGWLVEGCHQRREQERRTE